jgi:hypothetical protein
MAMRLLTSCRGAGVVQMRQRFFGVEQNDKENLTPSARLWTLSRKQLGSDEKVPRPWNALELVCADALEGNP